MIGFAAVRILGYALANFIWQIATGNHDWKFAATVSFFQAWAIAWTVRDTCRRISETTKLTAAIRQESTDAE